VVGLSESAPRDLVADALRSYLTPEQLGALLDEVLAITKEARGWCPLCKKHVRVDIPDAKAVVSAMGDLLTQGFGRPAQEGVEDGGDRIVLNRTIVFGGSENS
jgi:hypothetical protein